MKLFCYPALLFLACLCGQLNCFIPAKVLSLVIYKLESGFNSDLGKVSESLVHDEIMKRGLIQSVVKYFVENPRASSKVNVAKIDTGEYYDLRKLYFDYYGKGLCDDDIPLIDLIKYDFQPAVASIDFMSDTKDLPYAHFDAEAFNESNARVIEFKEKIKVALAEKKYDVARIDTGRILHTIHDFYSHSNWVEMGMTSIESRIGTNAFSDLQTVTVNDTDLCTHNDQNCSLIKEECSFWVKIFANLINAIGLAGEFVKCPLEYYKCTNNLIILDKLVSGYYTGQKLPNGDEYNKPNGLGKCSHGGILDGSSFVAAEGGINKDSGYTVFSPHADLHLLAANLAVNHTKVFLDEIRSDIGDAEFEKFLKIKVNEAKLSQVGDVTCAAKKLGLNSIGFYSFLVAVYTFVI